MHIMFGLQVGDTYHVWPSDWRYMSCLVFGLNIHRMLAHELVGLLLIQM